MAAIGQLFLEALADGKPVYGRDLASRLGVPADNIRLAGHRLVQRGYVQRAEGCYQITDAGQACLASGKHRTSGPERGDFVARGRMSLRARVWNLIRMRNLWSIDDLLMTVAAGTEKDAENGVRR